MKNHSKIFVLACIVFSICVSALQQCSSRAQNESETWQTGTNDNTEDLLEYE